MLQNAAARVVTQCNRREYITPKLQELHWLPVQQRLKFKILVITFKAVHGIGPQYLADIYIYMFVYMFGPFRFSPFHVWTLPFCSVSCSSRSVERGRVTGNARSMLATAP